MTTRFFVYGYKMCIYVYQNVYPCVSVLTDLYKDWTPQAELITLLL